MRPISFCKTASDCAEALREMNELDVQCGRHLILADYIHDLTRWIPVSERMPTRKDGDEDGYVLVSERQNETPHKRYTRYVKIDNLDDPDYFYTITHWQRITPPEDK